MPAFERLAKAEIAVVHRIEAHAVVRQHLPHHSAQALVIVDQQNREGRFDGRLQLLRAIPSPRTRVLAPERLWRSSALYCGP